MDQYDRMTRPLPRGLLVGTTFALSIVWTLYALGGGLLSAWVQSGVYVALLLLTRDHVPTTLASVAPPAAQPVGHADKAGQGHARHQEAWDWLAREGCLARAA